jgi:hypothetical protein
VGELGIDAAVALGCAALTQATSYCEGAPAALYAFPPVPPLVLLMPGSLNTDPGELAELPGRAEVCVQSWLGGPAYAGATAPVIMMPAIQVAAKNVRMIRLHSGAAFAHLPGYTGVTAITFNSQDADLVR